MGRAKRTKQSLHSSSSGTSEESRRWWYLWAALVGLISILIMAIWTIVHLSSYNTNEEIQYSLSNKIFRNSSRVRVEILPSPDSSFARKCAKAGVPVVLRNSVIKKWKATKWSPPYLQSRVKSLTGIYENNNRWFGPYFDRSKPLLELATRRNPYKTNIKLTSDEFFKRLKYPQEAHYHYFTGDIEQLGDWAYSDIQPIKELLLLNPKRSSINTWIGQPSVVAHCHYDGYHNFYAQLSGIKKFTLLNPTNWPGLYPYPFLHPSHAQAQVNVSDLEDVRRFGLVRRVEAQEVVLEPGDLLYIPPLWFHEVESLSVSISVNVWTDSQQTEMMERIFSLPLPLQSDLYRHHPQPSHGGHEHIEWQDERELVIGAAVLVLKLLEHICRYHKCSDTSNDHFYDAQNLPAGDSNGVYFVQQLWSTRYRYLMEAGELPSTPHKGAHILCEGDSENSTVTEMVHRAGERIREDVHYGAYFEEVSQLVRSLPKETWQLWVGNYVEYIAANAVSDVKYVGLFLKHLSSCIKFL